MVSHRCPRDCVLWNSNIKDRTQILFPVLEIKRVWLNSLHINICNVLLYIYRRSIMFMPGSPRKWVNTMIRYRSFAWSRYDTETQHCTMLNGFHQAPDPIPQLYLFFCSFVLGKHWRSPNKDIFYLQSLVMCGEAMVIPLFCWTRLWNIDRELLSMHCAFLHCAMQNGLLWQRNIFLGVENLNEVSYIPFLVFSSMINILLLNIFAMFLELRPHLFQSIFIL